MPKEKTIKAWAVIGRASNTLRFSGDDEEKQGDIFRTKKSAQFWCNFKYEKVVPCIVTLLKPK